MYRLQNTGGNQRKTNGVKFWPAKAPQRTILDSSAATTESTSKPPRGRFAPSPTGPLHFGSLVAALGSFLEAKTQGGGWLLRMDDLDRTREVPGASDDILRTLDAFGFAWDGEVLYQSQRGDTYHQIFEELDRLGVLYPCGCSRKTIAAFGLTGPEGWIYPGTCRGKTPRKDSSRAWRIHTEAVEIQFTDTIQGSLTQHLERDIGDFILRRSDGLFAYQLAVVADDTDQGITQVARGADLLLSTPRQIYLQQLLELPTPHYAHLPVAVDRTGKKLSKQSAAIPVDSKMPLPALLAAMSHLGQDIEERPANLAEFWHWAISTWDISKVPQRQHYSLLT